MNTGEIEISEKGKNSNSKITYSYTNVEKAKELFLSVTEYGQTPESVKNKGFKFSYDDKDLPLKFKKLFGKDGVMDLLADAWMTRDWTSKKTYNFVDLRNELKVYYKNLKVETYKNCSKEDLEEIAKLTKKAKELLIDYNENMKKSLEKIENVKKNHKSINEITKAMKIVTGVIAVLGTLSVQPTILAVGTIITGISTGITCLNELYIRVEISSIKTITRETQAALNGVFKKIKDECIGMLGENNNIDNKTIIIKKYDKESLKRFDEKCKECAKKYDTKISKVKFWSRNLLRWKTIFKGGISNLMEEN